MDCNLSRFVRERTWEWRFVSSTILKGYVDDAKRIPLVCALESYQRIGIEVVEDSSALQKLKNEKDEIEKQKSSLEKAIEHSQEKLVEIEAKANRLESELESSEKSVRNFKEQNHNYTATARDLEAADAKKGSKGMKL
ncbi:hypothetical protein NE237_000351 [Protea cynaroides]|uniref:Uncharacterized protein n=1 Tax=Protea cynaroides TaxID=273540 RepID=A0A9Q0KRB6_9MAGN|nr:hypothetical protein NE237_000351 [Protea cynaroides]